MSAARPARPTFMTSGPVAEVLAAALWDYAQRLESEPTTAPVGSQIRLVRRSARELLAVHDIDPADVLVDAPAPEREAY